jgi:hypothetical protein
MSKIFLAPIPNQEYPKKNLLEAILKRAGIEITSPTISDLNELVKSSEQELKSADSMVLVLTKDYGVTIDESQLESFTRHIFKIGLELCKSDPSFKMFIWHHPELLEQDIDIFQQEFINEIRYSLNKNMVFSTVSSPIQFVEDLRNMMVEKEVKSFNVSNTDIFLIFNEVDEYEAKDIIDMLSDVIDVEKLNIVQENDVDYAELCSQQIKQSKLAVVYFKETADWALPFVQQIWKKVGGASSHTPILFIGDENPSSNLGKKFNAPKIISYIVAGDLIPLEIKVQFDKLIQE